MDPSNADATGRPVVASSLPGAWRNECGDRHLAANPDTRHDHMQPEDERVSGDAQHENAIEPPARDSVLGRSAPILHGARATALAGAVLIEAGHCSDDGQRAVAAQTPVEEPMLGDARLGEIE
jgi:hypothetical protein